MVMTKAVDMTVQHWKTGLSPIHMIASTIKNYEMLSSILAAVDKSHFGIKDMNGNTPLHYAAFNRNQVMC